MSVDIDPHGKYNRINSIHRIIFGSKQGGIIMSKKIIGILLCVAMTAAMLCVGCVAASAQNSCTYYFLAPDSWFKTEAGADNELVGAYWWEPSEFEPWPGVTLAEAPEIGRNVFKLENMSPETTNIIFSSFFESDDGDAQRCQTKNINTEGYTENEAYEGCPVCDSFDGMIYVLDMKSPDTRSEYSETKMFDGAWFTLDTYKENKTYYGSYGFDDSTDSEYVPSNTKYHKGDLIAAVMTVGGLTLDGEPAKLGAYNYDITFDPQTVKCVACADMTTGGSFIYNDGYQNAVLLCNMAALGVDGDFSGDKAPAAAVLLKVTADTNDLRIAGECTSLSEVSMDGSKMKTLVGVNNPEDRYTELVLDTDIDKYADLFVIKDDDTSSKPYYGDSEEDVPIDRDTDAYYNNNRPNVNEEDSVNDTDAGADKEAADTTSSNASTASTASRVTSPKTGSPTNIVIVPALIIMAAAAAVMLSKRKAEEQ